MDTSPDSLALWDQVLNMQAVIATVAYNGRNLNVWKDPRDSGHIRYYVTPLCELILNSLRVDKNDYAHIYMLRFSIRSWDSSIVKLVEKELINKGHPTSVTIKMASGEVNVPCEILPLPMQNVRINAASFMQNYLDLNWRPNLNQPNEMTFELRSSNEGACHKLLDDAKADPEMFLLNTELKFEFTLRGNRQEYRDFKVTSEVLYRSSFFSELSNKFGNKGYVYLLSGDLNRLSRELVIDVKGKVTKTDGYIETSEENQLIQGLFENLKQQRDLVGKISEDDWNSSVFWQDDFSRPDVQTEYTNEVFKHDESTDRSISNSTQDEKFREKTNSENSSSTNVSGSLDVNYKPTGVGAKGGFDYSKQTNSKNMHELVNDSNSSLSNEVLQNRINQIKTYVEWKGQKFEPKDLELYRVNLQSLKDRRDIFFKGVTLISVANTYKIEILPEIPDLPPALVENILIPEQDILMPEISPIEMTRKTIECKKYVNGGIERDRFATCVFENKIYVFGGSMKTVEEEFTIAIFDTNNKHWMQSNQKLDTMKRIGHTTVVYNGKVYLWGGLYWGESSLPYYLSGGKHNLYYFFEIDAFKQNNSSRVIDSHNFLQTLYLHTAVVYKDGMYLFGGAKTPFHFKYNCFTNETIIFHFPTKKWSIVNTTGRPPSAREKHTACIYDNCMYIFFGRILSKTDDVEDKDESIIKYLDLNTHQWHKVQTRGDVPCARYDHATLEYNGKIYLFGGYYKGKIFNDLYEFDPITNTWTKLMPIGNEPPGIRRMSMVAVGNKIYLFGGQTRVNDDFIYNYDLYVLEFSNQE